MPTSDPGLRWVTVHAGAQAVDLTLPAAVPVATLIPSIVDILGDRGASPATAARYQLSALGRQLCQTQRHWRNAVSATAPSWSCISPAPSRPPPL